MTLYNCALIVCLLVILCYDLLLHYTYAIYLLPMWLSFMIVYKNGDYLSLYH